MSEVEAIAYINTEVSKTVQASSTEVIARKYEGMSIYKATIVVIMDDDVLVPQTLIDLYNKIKNDSLDMNVVGTSKDIKDLTFEVLTIEAEITIGE